MQKVAAVNGESEARATMVHGSGIQTADDRFLVGRTDDDPVRQLAAAAVFHRDRDGAGHAERRNRYGYQGSAAEGYRRRRAVDIGDRLGRKTSAQDAHVLRIIAYGQRRRIRRGDRRRRRVVPCDQRQIDNLHLRRRRHDGHRGAVFAGGGSDRDCDCAQGIDEGRRDGGRDQVLALNRCRDRGTAPGYLVASQEVMAGDRERGRHTQRHCYRADRRDFRNAGVGQIKDRELRLCHSAARFRVDNGHRDDAWGGHVRSRNSDGKRTAVDQVRNKLLVVPPDLGAAIKAGP